MKPVKSKRVKRCICFGLIAAAMLGAASCPVEFTPEEARDIYKLAPLGSLVVHETFDTLNAGPLEIGRDAPLERGNGVFWANLHSKIGRLSIVSEGRGKALKLQNLSGSGASGLDSYLFYVPSPDALGAMANKKVLLQFRVRLQNTNNVTAYAGTVYHTRIVTGAPSGNTSVQARINGEGTFQFNNNDNTWELNTVTQNEWHNVEILLDYGEKVYRGYVDSVPVIDNYLYNKSGDAFGTVRFSIANYNTALYLDDIRVSTDSITGPFTPPPEPCEGDCGCGGLGCNMLDCSCAQPGTFLADEDFEGLMDGKAFTSGETLNAEMVDVEQTTFTALVPSGSIGIEEEDGSKVLKITGGASGNTMFRYDTTTTIQTAVSGQGQAEDNKKVYISFRAKYNGTGTANILWVSHALTYGGSGGNTILTNNYGSANGGTYQYHNGSSYVSKTGVAPDAWHKFGVVMDFATKASAFVLDGETIGEDVPFRVSAGATFGSVCFVVSNNDGTVLWLDDIRISYDD
jgi:hypothetical protein